MFANLPRIADGQLRRLLRSSWRAAQTVWDWYRELGHADESEARGLKLLREWLSPAQLAQYDAHRYFDVTGCHSGKRYRIRQGTAANVYELDDADRPKAGWCFVPRDCAVAGDVMLAQKLALEMNERDAMAVARKFGLSRWSAP